MGGGFDLNYTIYDVTTKLGYPVRCRGTIEFASVSKEVAYGKLWAAGFCLVFRRSVFLPPKTRKMGKSPL